MLGKEDLLLLLLHLMWPVAVTLAMEEEVEMVPCPPPPPHLPLCRAIGYFTYFSRVLHGLNLFVKLADAAGEGLPVGDDELVAEGARDQHDVVDDEAEKNEEGIVCLAKNI
jgi:hypothetical protein